MDLRICLSVLLAGLAQDALLVAQDLFQSPQFIRRDVPVLSARPLELVPRVSRWLHPAFPSDALSPPKVEDIESFWYHDGDDLDQVSW